MTCVIYDLIDCVTPSPEPRKLLDAMRTAVARLGATALGEPSVLFQPHGIICVLVLAESHLVVSTWPEHKVAHIDLIHLPRRRRPRPRSRTHRGCLRQCHGARPAHQARDAIFSLRNGPPGVTTVVLPVMRLGMRVCRWHWGSHVV